MKNYKELASQIVDYIGGPENVDTHTHCMTRLRFTLKDDSKAQTEALKALKGVQGVIEKGGMYQVVIGTDVEQLYNEVAPLLGNAKATEVVNENLDDKKKETVTNKIFTFISGCITPTLPVLIGSGLISAILALLTNFNNESPRVKTRGILL